ncbi:hypothetical protein FIBSPDRAFT_583104 [Athelia psychrophila]|uniref:Secreted protein n=1 Tax=Athelia psychrophila TaxID=1759441 RepID=A0A166UNF9_9AGAM|nr:hypothetical protein FIBSPDRAFT_583104 [Fibularhizoctonia sp. CBS 109695]
MLQLNVTSSLWAQLLILWVWVLTQNVGNFESDQLAQKQNSCMILRRGQLDSSATRQGCAPGQLLGHCLHIHPGDVVHTGTVQLCVGSVRRVGTWRACFVKIQERIGTGLGLSAFATTALLIVHAPKPLASSQIKTPIRRKW